MSSPTFIRGFHSDNKREVLFNINHIWKIEMQYVIVSEDGTPYGKFLFTGQNDPNAIRIYDVFVGNEKFRFEPNPGNPAFKIIEEIYKNALT